MTLPCSGPLSFSNIQTEFGGTHPISMAEYYGAAATIPAIGIISASNFQCASSYIPLQQTIDFTSSTTWTAPPQATQFQIIAIGGGGAGSQGGYDNGDNGIGGCPGDFIDTSVILPAGSTFNISIGQGAFGTTGPGISGSPTVVTQGSNQWTALGGTGAGTGNALGDNSQNTYYLTMASGSPVITTNSTVANSYYTTLTGIRTGGYSISVNMMFDGIEFLNHEGSNGVFGGGGGGGKARRNASPFSFTVPNGRGGSGGNGFVRIIY